MADSLSIDDLNLEDKINEGAMNGVAKAARRVETAIKQNLTDNGSVITGGLRDSVFPVPDGPTLEVEVAPKKDYAADVEFGTPEHEILPVNKKALYWEGAEHPVKRVMHPGSDPKPYVGPAWDAERENVIQDVKDEIEAALGVK